MGGVYKNISVLMLLFCGVLLLGCKDNAKSTENKKQSEENAALYQKYKDLPKCESNVLVELGDVTLSVKREKELSWRDISGRLTEGHFPDLPAIPNPDHPLYDCSIEKIKDIWKISGRSVIASIHNPDNGDIPNSETTYQRHETLYQKAVQENRIQHLPSGMEKFIHLKGRENEIYLVSTSIFKTGNNEPVLIYCGGLEVERSKRFSDRCGYTYYVTSEVMLKNGFLRSEVAEDEYIQMLEKSRDYFESLVVSKARGD